MFFINKFFKIILSATYVGGKTIQKKKLRMMINFDGGEGWSSAGQSGGLGTIDKALLRSLSS